MAEQRSTAAWFAFFCESGAAPVTGSAYVTTHGLMLQGDFLYALKQGVGVRRSRNAQVSVSSR